MKLKLLTTFLLIIFLKTTSFGQKTWTGTTSSDWATVSNWNPQGVPTSSDDVTIAQIKNKPSITSMTANVKSLTINSGATLTLTNNATSLLNITGDFTNNGTLTAGATSAVTFGGSTASVIQGSSSSTFGNLSINKSATTVANDSKAFAVTSNLTITSGNLILAATDKDYTIGNNLIVATAGTLTHNVDWSSEKKMVVSGSIAIDGLYASGTNRTHVNMNKGGTYIRTGGISSALKILTFSHNSGTITASGLVTINDNFWCNWTVDDGKFSTGAYTVNANAGLNIAGGDVSIASGGILNVRNDGLLVGTTGFKGAVNLLSGGTLNADVVNIGEGAIKGTFNHTGGVANIGDLTINGTGANAYICTGSPVINISGNWMNNKTFTAASSTVNFVGTSVHTINGTLSVAGKFFNLTFNGVGGKWTNNAPMDVAGTLTMTNGILTTSTTTIINLTNTATTAIGGGTATSFVNGPIKWALPANLVIGSTYNFPVGKGTTYLPFSLVNPTRDTGTGAITAQVEAYNANSGGSPIFNSSTTTLGSLSKTEYWSLGTTGNFTNSFISVSRPSGIALFDAIGGSATINGTYSSLGGAVQVNGITNSTLIGSNKFFTFASKNGIKTGSISSSSFCAESTVSVPFTITGAYLAGNIFTAQLSDASGSFASPVNIGTVSGTVSGTISGTIPKITTAGTGYRIRVVSSNPSFLGQDNGSNLTINAALSITLGTNPVISQEIQTAILPYTANNAEQYQIVFDNVGLGQSGSLSSSSGDISINVPSCLPVGVYSGYIKLIRYTPSCTGSSTFPFTISVVPDITRVGTLGNNQNICSNTAPAAIELSGGTAQVIRWEKSINSTFSPLDKIVNNTKILTSAQMGALNVNTYFRAVFKPAGCDLTSNVVLITVNGTLSVPKLGTETQPTCAKPTGSIILIGLPTSGAVKQTGTVVKDYPYTEASGVKLIEGLVSGTYQFAVSSGTCSTTSEKTVDVVISNPLTKTWNGSDWLNDALVVVTAPTIDNPLIFKGNYSSTKDLSGCSCTVTSGAVTINSEHTMTITNEVVVNGGSLTFENNASLVQINDVPTRPNSGVITYIRVAKEIRRQDYTYWSSPVSGMTMHALSPQTLASKYMSYKNGWVYSEGGIDIMRRGVGYTMRGPETYSVDSGQDFTASFVGVPNNGVVEVPIAGTWNLIGNPYPSAVFANDFLTLNENLYGTLYFWTHNTLPSTAITGSYDKNYTSDDYAVYNLTGPIATGPAKTTGNKDTPNGYIGAGQSFFVAAIAGADKVSFTNDMRYGGANNIQFFKMSTPKKVEKDRIWLNLTNEQGLFKQILIGYVKGATNNYDRLYDGVSFNANSFADFYSVNNGSRLTIQGRALPFLASEEIPLGFKVKLGKGLGVVNQFTISIDHADGGLENQGIYLFDAETNSAYDLRKSNYTFKSADGTFNDRFILKYSNQTLGVTDFESRGEMLVVSVISNVITIDSKEVNIDKVFVYDIAGKMIFSNEKVGNSVLKISTLKTNNQVLLVKIQMENEIVVTKKVVLNSN